MYSTAPLDGVTDAGGMVLGILFRIAGIATALTCVLAGIRVIRGSLIGSSGNIVDGLVSLVGVAVGAVITFTAPDVAETILRSAGGSGTVAGGPFAAVVGELIRMIQRIGIVAATVGFVWHGTAALIDLAAQGGGFRAGDLAPKYVALTLTMLALWKAPEIVTTLAPSFMKGF